MLKLGTSFENKHNISELAITKKGLGMFQYIGKIEISKYLSIKTITKSLEMLHICFGPVQSLLYDGTTSMMKNFNH